MAASSRGARHSGLAVTSRLVAERFWMRWKGRKCTSGPVFQGHSGETAEGSLRTSWAGLLAREWLCVHISLALRALRVVFVAEGFKEAAEKFRMESGIEPSVDLETLDERIKIREMLLKGQIQEAIALINSLHPELLDTNRYLYFHLQVGLAERRPACAHSTAWVLCEDSEVTRPVC